MKKMRSWHVELEVSCVSPKLDANQNLVTPKVDPMVSVVQIPFKKVRAHTRGRYEIPKHKVLPKWSLT